MHAVHLDDAIPDPVPRPGKYELFISPPRNVGQVQVKYPMATVGPISVDLYEIRISAMSASWDTTDARPTRQQHRGVSSA